ncbi:hypothetical protein CPB84DRAFT_1744751 [Gymnopilus junonius]|uniref:Uncharacterized protein n=1 Tax=Gymnopilus junonius TaxID=109634 RepID=A0A9P5NUB5_GYMJU|nr:hypothetical protein CPB84DRAFT_1744751 [Gymnopilus junonius]
MVTGSWEFDHDTFCAYFELDLVVEFQCCFSPLLVAFPWQWDSIVLHPEHILDYVKVMPQFQLFEIAALLHGCMPQSIPSATHPHLHLLKVKLGRQSHEKEDLYGYTKLHDWISLAYSFKAAVESYVDKEPEIPVSLPSNPIESLLCMLHANEKKMSYNVIKSNFICAVIHVGCQRMVVFPEHMVPDLPGDLQKLGYSPTTNQEADSSLGVDLTVSQSYRYKFIDYGADKPKNNLAADHVMLTVAELIMPFYLWMPFKLAKKSFGHCTVLDHSSQLGPDKPPTVLNVEMACWKTVFCLSEGRTKPYHALRDLALSIDWQEVDWASSSVHECTWFSLEERSHQRNQETLGAAQILTGHFLCQCIKEYRWQRSLRDIVSGILWPLLRRSSVVPEQESG